MQVTSLGFRTDLMIRRMAGSIVEDHGSWMVVKTPGNPNFWWGNFLLLPSPAGRSDVDEWIRRFRTEFPRATHRAFGIDGTKGETGSDEELVSMGVKSDVSVVLTAARLAEPHPVQADCRALSSDDDWSQAVRLRREVYGQHDDEAGAAFLSKQVDETRHLVGEGHGATFGAFVDGRLVSALGIFSDGSGVARYQSVETHPGYRRHGFAQRLMYDAGQYASEEHRAHTLVVVADPEYHAINLYRSLGFVDVERQVQLQGVAVL